jgi:hypothetical protein
MTLPSGASHRCVHEEQVCLLARARIVSIGEVTLDLDLNKIIFPNFSQGRLKITFQPTEGSLFPEGTMVPCI